MTNPTTTRAFDLPDHLAAKADPALIAADEQHFAAIAESLERSIAELPGTARRSRARRPAAWARRRSTAIRRSTG